MVYFFIRIKFKFKKWYFQILYNIFIRTTRKNNEVPFLIKIQPLFSIALIYYYYHRISFCSIIIHISVNINIRNLFRFFDKSNSVKSSLHFLSDGFPFYFHQIAHYYPHRIRKISSKIPKAGPNKG